MSTLGFGKPTLRAFGKLPIAGDFLSHGASRGVAEEWRDWLSSAFADEATTSAKTLTNRIYRFWFRGEREGMLRTPVAGFLIDSTDRLRRRFPFSWYTTAASSARGGDGALRAGLPVWAALGGLLPKLSGVASAEDLYEILNQAPIARLLEQEQGRDLRDETSIGDLLDSLFSGDEETSLRFIGRMRRVFAMSDSEGSQARLAVKLPLNSGIGSDAQASVWLRILDARPGGSKCDAPNVMLPGDRRTSDPMFIFFRELRPEDGRRLFLNGTESQGFFDLTHLNGDSAEDDAAAGRAVMRHLDRSTPALAVSPDAFWRH